MPPRAFEWVEGAQRYRDAKTKRFIPRDDVVRETYRVVEAAGTDAMAIADAYASRAITKREFERQMRGLIMDSHVMASAAANGGLDQLTASDLRDIRARVRAQYRYLDGFLRDLSTGTQRLDGTFRRRAELYGLAARETYVEHDRGNMRALGYTEERNVLHPADHCDECVEYAERGRVPIGTTPPPGQRLCRARCRCTMRYYGRGLTFAEGRSPSAVAAQLRQARTSRQASRQRTRRRTA